MDETPKLNPNEYIDNEYFEKLIVRCVKDKNNRELKEELGCMFEQIARNIIKSFHYNFVEPEDAIQEGVKVCLTKIERFDPNYQSKKGNKKVKSKAFNYYSTCIINTYNQIWRSAKNYRELKKKYFERQLMRHGVGRDDNSYGSGGIDYQSAKD